MTAQELLAAVAKVDAQLAEVDRQTAMFSTGLYANPEKVAQLQTARRYLEAQRTKLGEQLAAAWAGTMPSKPAPAEPAGTVYASTAEQKNGLVWVLGVPVAFKPETAVRFKAQVWERWRPLVVEHAKRAGVEEAMIAALVWAESEGITGIVSHDGGVGLMQLTHPAVFQGVSREEAMAPSVNIRLGSDLIAKLGATGDRRPWALASRYNAGTAKGGQAHPSSVAPWYMHASGTHITRAMAAYNQWKALTGASAKPAAEPGMGLGAKLLIGGVALGGIYFLVRSA
jgi:soluble lytic murein transglycosylase-like protein